MEGPMNINGGLTIVPLTPAFLPYAQAVKEMIESGEGPFKIKTPVDIAPIKFGEHKHDADPRSAEPYAKLTKKHIGGHDCFLLGSGPGTWEVIGKYQIALKYLVGREARRISMIAGYFPLTRSDKDDGEDILAMVGMITRIFEDAGEGQLTKIIAADLHAQQSVVGGKKTALLVEVSMARRVLRKMLLDVIDKYGYKVPVVIVPPDKGAYERFKPIIKMVMDEFKNNHPDLTIHHREGEKFRTDSTMATFLGVTGDTSVLPGAIILCFDDEIAKGDTVINTARALREKYPIIDYWAGVTHGVFSYPAPERFSELDCPVSRVYASNTIPFEQRPELTKLITQKKFRLVSWVDELAKIIYYRHLGESIRNIR